MALTEADVQAVVDGILGADVTLYTADSTVGEALHRIRYLARSIYVDTDAPINGDGSQGNPFNVINDAKDFAEAEGIRNIIVAGEIVVPSNLRNMNIYGIGLPIINLNGQDIKNTKFHQVQLTGAYTSQIIADNCKLLDGFQFDGHFHTCQLMGDHFAKSNTEILLVDCLSGIPGLGRPTLSMNFGLPTAVSIRGQRGGLTIKDCDHIDDVITVEVAQGSLTFDSSCVLGTMVARGGCKFVDETNGATVTDETYDDHVDIVSVQGTDVVSVDDFKADLSVLPTLLDIEASTVLAKESSLSVVETIVNSLPQLAEIRAEMINVQFGGLTIANNQMSVTDQAGVVIVIFDLFDNNGNPTMNMVYKREVV